MESRNDYGGNEVVLYWLFAVSDCILSDCNNKTKMLFKI